MPGGIVAQTLSEQRVVEGRHGKGRRPRWLAEVGVQPGRALPQRLRHLLRAFAHLAGGRGLSAARENRKIRIKILKMNIHTPYISGKIHHLKSIPSGVRLHPLSAVKKVERLITTQNCILVASGSATTTPGRVRL